MISTVGIENFHDIQSCLILALPKCTREELTLFEAVDLIVPIVLKLGLDEPSPGEHRAANAEWAACDALARRNVQEEAEIDGGLTGQGIKSSGGSWHVVRAH